ncbi:MAG: hypothetical protein QOI81_172 [Actinomycetota bacterium]|jgi:hypothetical protein|nr:hypothetical protein [Actinomycetota bacterium]
MAIKGKKSRSKPKAPARAPRREIVELPTPFLQRRAVQLVLALIAGLLIFWFGVWLTNGLRVENNKKKATAAQAVKSVQASKRRLAVQSWKGTVDTAIGTIGTAPTGPGNPAVFADLSTATAALGKGTVPSGLSDTVKAAGTDAKAAEKALNGVDIPTKIVQGKGFDVSTTNSLIGSKSQMLAAIDLYNQSATLTQLGADATGATRTRLAAQAAALQSSAATLFNDGWRQLQEALASVGIYPPPPSGAPPVPGGVGSIPAGS